jgi:1,4-alpha-glucan branching enzyme
VAVLLAALALGSAVRSESVLPDLPKVVVYEANLRAFGPEHGFEALERRLGDIERLGVNVIWLMPIQPVGKVRSVGGLGSPYAVADYDAVNTEFGTAAQFKRLIIDAHRHRIAVILDWVADHTAWDNPWVALHSDWYLHTPTGEISVPTGTQWNDVAGLDYRNLKMRQAMVDAMKWWVARYDIDGFRCDAADRVPAEFWKDAISELRSAAPKPLLMLAEGFRPEDYASGFDLTYGWNLNYKLREAFAGKPASDVVASAKFEQRDVPAGARRLRFITNHDLSAWEGSLIDFYKTAQGVRAAFAVTALLGGNPLVYSGQEVGWDKRVPIFDRSSIDWGRDTETAQWMSRVLSLRAAHPSLIDGTTADLSTADVVFFRREARGDEALVAINVRADRRTVPVSERFVGIWTDGMSGARVDLGPRLEVSPYQTVVLLRKGAR